MIPLTRVESKYYSRLASFSFPHINGIVFTYRTTNDKK